MSDGGPVGDSGLEHLINLQSLTTLELPDAQITNAGLVHIAGLRNLESLDLESTRITEAGLIHLERLDSLQSVYADNTDIPAEVLKALWEHGSRFREEIERFGANDSAGTEEPETTTAD